MANPTGKGGFKRGNRGGPGRPRRSAEQNYLATMTGVVSLKDWRDITARAVQDAKAGDNQARAWLSKHLVGDEPLALAELLKKVGDLEEAMRERERVQLNGRASADRAATEGGEGLPGGTGPGIG